jgi:hypothetical protein
MLNGGRWKALTRALGRLLRRFAPFAAWRFSQVGPKSHEMTRSKKLDRLVSRVEDLLARLPDHLTPEVAELRDKVDAAIFEAWTCIAGEGRDTLNRASRRSAERFWTTVGLALLAGTASLLVHQFTRPTAR